MHADVRGAGNGGRRLPGDVGAANRGAEKSDPADVYGERFHDFGPDRREVWARDNVRKRGDGRARCFLFFHDVWFVSCDLFEAVFILILVRAVWPGARWTAS